MVRNVIILNVWAPQCRSRAGAKEAFIPCASVPVWQMYSLKVTASFSGLRGNLATDPGQAGLDFKKVFAMLTVISEIEK